MQRNEKDRRDTNSRRLRGMGLTPEQRKWSDTRVGRKVHGGVIVSYEPDKAGCGAIFTIYTFNGDEDVVYRRYPRTIRRRGVEDSFIRRNQNGRDEID